MDGLRAMMLDLYGVETVEVDVLIASDDNDLADGPSRGGGKLADALRMAAASGMRVERLEPDPQWRDASALIEIASGASEA